MPQVNIAGRSYHHLFLGTYLCIIESSLPLLIFVQNFLQVKVLADFSVLLISVYCVLQVMSDFKRLVSEKHFETLRQNLPKLCSAVEKMSKSDFGEVNIY